VGAGVLDPNYRSEIKVLVINNGEVPFAYNKGDRIAYVICERVCVPVIEVTDNLNATSRGAHEFGSSG
ncbi:hypothetical protein N320_02493, partial [Buceros rhinoceros silvestris]